VSIRVLVVDDFAPFREFISALLQKRPELQVVGEASDGVQAITKATELQPEVVLLDIAMPALDGLEAAKGIRARSPNSRILFASQESSPDLVREAFGVGAYGYVVKADAASELLAAVDAVIRGERFLGSRFVNLDLTFPGFAI